MLENVKHVEYLMGSISNADPVAEINLFLKLGWKLLNVHEARVSTQGPGPDDSSSATIGYIVGWDDRYSPPTYPKGGFHERCGRLPKGAAVAGAE